MKRRKRPNLALLLLIAALLAAMVYVVAKDREDVRLTSTLTALLRGLDRAEADLLVLPPAAVGADGPGPAQLDQASERLSQGLASLYTRESLRNKRFAQLWPLIEEQGDGESMILGFWIQDEEEVALVREGSWILLTREGVTARVQQSGRRSEEARVSDQALFEKKGDGYELVAWDSRLLQEAVNPLTPEPEKVRRSFHGW